LDNENRVIVTLAHDRSDSFEAHGAMILDIDRIVEKVISPEWHALEAEMEKLHEAVWVVFEAARGPNLEALLQGKLQT
jgi:hypothetical protein